jgi:hypothetical protein
MNARIISSVAAGGVLALVVSCSQDQSRGVPVPTEASYGKSTTPTCSFSTANNDAKAYFSNSKDEVFTLLSAQQAAYKLGAANATSAGLAVLGRLGVATDLGLVKATADSVLGSKFANDVLLCTDLSTGIDYSAALGNKGLFAVRAVGNTAAVLSRYELPNGDPLYGAEPTTSAGWQFTGSATNKALFYAAPVVTTIGDPTVGTVFDLKTLPTPLTFSPSIRVGVCDMTITDGRIEHVHGSAVILPPSAPTFCTSSSGMLEPSRSMLASVAHEMASWFAPRPAYAASRSMFATFSGGGGLVTGLSEIGPVNVLEALTMDSIPNASVSDTALAIDTLSTGELNLNTSQFNPVVKVHVLTTAGTPIAGVLVKLTVIGNKGSFAATGDTATTAANGDASFPNLSINKAGGYTVSATVPELGGDVVLVSNQFQINGQ